MGPKWRQQLLLAYFSGTPSPRRQCQSHEEGPQLGHAGLFPIVISVLCAAKYT